MGSKIDVGSALLECASRYWIIPFPPQMIIKSNIYFQNLQIARFLKVTPPFHPIKLDSEERDWNYLVHSTVAMQNLSLMRGRGWNTGGRCRHKEASPCFLPRAHHQPIWSCLENQGSCCGLEFRADCTAMHTDVLVSHSGAAQLLNIPIKHDVPLVMLFLMGNSPESQRSAITDSQNKSLTTPKM